MKAIPKPKHARFEYWKGFDGQWYGHLKAPNGEIIAQSEGYKRKAAVKKWMEKLQMHASNALVREHVQLPYGYENPEGL